MIAPDLTGSGTRGIFVQSQSSHLATMNKSIFTSALFLLCSIVAPVLSASPGVKGDKPEKIAHGATVDIKEYIVAGKITVFDFTSEYCPPCRQISPMLDDLHARRADLAVVKIDINRPETKGIDWKSPVAQQYKLNSIPHFKVYGADGKLMAEGDAASTMVEGWLEQK